MDKQMRYSSPPLIVKLPNNVPAAYLSRSHSHSPLYDYSTSSRYRSRSRSPERRLSPRRRDKKWSSPRSNDDRRSSPRRSREKRSSPRRSGERQSPSRGSDARRSPSRSSEETRSAPRRSHERQSPTEGSSLQRKKSSSAERLAKKLLETSAVQSLSKQSDLEAVVKTLAPALLAELAKLKSTSSSSSSSSTATKKELTTKVSKAKSSLQKSEASSSTKTKSGKSSPPTMVRLQGIYNCLSHNDVVTAVGQFGKTKSVVLFRSRLEAIVCFEKEEDAKKLKNLKSFHVKGMAVTVVREKETVPKELKKPSQNKPAASSVSTPQSTKATTTSTTEKDLLSIPLLLKGPLPSAAEKAPTGKLTKQKVAAKGSVKGLTTVTRAKVLVSKAKNVSTKQIPKAVKTGKLPAKGAVKKVGVKKKIYSGSKSVASDSKQKFISEKSESSVEESVVMLKEATKVDESTKGTVTQPTNGKEIVTKAKVSKAAAVSATQKPETPNKSTASENRPDVENSKPKECEAKVQEAVVEPKDAAEIVETANGKVFEPTHQEKLDKAHDTEDAEPMEVGKTGDEVAEPMEVESCAEGEGKETTTKETEPEKSADKPNDGQSPTITVQTQPTETSVKALPHVQQNTLAEPESTAQRPENKTEASQMQQQAAGSPAEAETAVKTHTNAASAKDASVTTEATAAAVGKKLQAASTPSSTAVTPVYVRKMLEKRLYRRNIGCLQWNICFAPRFFELGKKQLLITGLPRYYDGCYTEEDVARSLVPFGFQYEDDSIYVIPQTCMAFVHMPTLEKVHDVLAFSGRNGIFFKGSRLCFHVVSGGMTMTPFAFYKRLMKLIKFRDADDNGEKTIFIKNISPSEAKELREAVKRIGSVKIYLPLLNKVFIQFMFVRDADRLGVWNSLLKQPPGYEVHRLRVPHRSSTSQSPKRPETTLPDNKDSVAGATMPTAEINIPQGSASPFWVTLRSSPFLFPTICPWFLIPDYVTATGKKSILKSRPHCSTCPTIMLTGLPNENYKHEDVAKLVWKYFPKQNLHSLYYNVTVLPLQRRAFVYFVDWTTCCDFVQDHFANGVWVKGSKLSVHFVLDHMKPESSEEMMYKTLMKWSNAGVPEAESLEERLLCVEISEMSLEVIRTVMAAVASVANFVSFLPLANRICIEMANSSSVTQVLEKYKTLSQDLFRHPVWNKIQCFENLKSLKQRLNDSSEITINFGPDTIKVEAQPPAVKCQTQPPPSERSDNGSQRVLQTSGPVGSTISEPVRAGPSTAAASDKAVKEEDDEKPETEVAVDSSGCPEANEDVEKVKREEESVTTLISTADMTSTSAVRSGNSVPAASATALKPEENVAKVPEIDTDIFKALMEAVRHHRLTRGSKSQSEAKAAQDDCMDDIVSSETCHFDEQSFNMDDFVTVDEVGDDVEDTKPEPDSSSSSSSRARRERRSSGVSSGGKQTSTRSSKDYKSSASSSSPSSKLTKGSSSSNLSCVSLKKSKDSSEPAKSPTKSSSSASFSKASSSSLSTQTPSSPGQKTQQNKMQFPSKESTSSGYGTHSPSAAREREKITSAATLEASIEIHPEPLREDAKDAEAAVAKSDHKVSAEGIAAKAVESETTMETSSEMHPHPQGHGVELNQGQSLEKRKEDDKQTEDDDNGENYQILDSLDDQTDEQDSSSETQQTGPEEGQTLHEECFQTALPKNQQLQVKKTVALSKLMVQQ
ncbi:uncharacterized protein ABDE67_020489 [Symphorus nematophorus]